MLLYPSPAEGLAYLQGDCDGRLVPDAWFIPALKAAVKRRQDEATANDATS